MQKKAKKMQNLKNLKKSRAAYFSALSTLAFFANLFLPSLTFGQTDISIDVTRTPFLSFLALPESFSFGSVTSSITDTHLFSDSDGGLPMAQVLMVRDTRGSGGFSLQAVASGPFVASGAPSNTIPATNLRMVTSTSLGVALDASAFNGVGYLSGFIGTPDNTTVQNIVAPLNATSNAFGTVTPFDEVENLPADNNLDTPVVLMDGCLTAAEGRVGTMFFGTSETLLVPKYQQPGSYTTTITYTLTDNTPASC